MLKVSEIISKEIISIYECESIGTIKDVILNKDLTKITKFVFFNDETDVESCVLINNIYSFSEDGVLVKNLSKVDFIAGEENNPINKRIFTLSAVDCGKINDIIIDEVGKVIKYITTSKKEIKSENVVSFGQVCIISNDEKKPRISSFRPRQKFNSQIQNLDNINVKIVNMNQNTYKERDKSLPKLPIKITTNANSLIGKQVSKTITGFNNEIIIKQFNTITKHTLEMAKIHNKTNELIFNAI